MAPPAKGGEEPVIDSIQQVVKGKPRIPTEQDDFSGLVDMPEGYSAILQQLIANVDEGEGEQMPPIAEFGQQSFVKLIVAEHGNVASHAGFGQRHPVPQLSDDAFPAAVTVHKIREQAVHIEWGHLIHFNILIGHMPPFLILKPPGFNRFGQRLVQAVGSTGLRI